MSRRRRVAQRHGAHHYVWHDGDGYPTIQGTASDAGGGTRALAADATAPGGGAYKITSTGSGGFDRELGATKLQVGLTFWIGMLGKQDFTGNLDGERTYFYLYNGSTYYALARKDGNDIANDIWFPLEASPGFTDPVSSGVKSIPIGANTYLRMRLYVDGADDSTYWNNLYAFTCDACRPTGCDKAEARSLHVWPSRAVGV